jgi:exodeoxyribonuclease VII large subunit
MMVQWNNSDEQPIEQPELFKGRLTVTQLTDIIKRQLENNIPTIAVEGELSNYVHHSSGHRYFTLKDATSQIRCVMFRWQAEKITFIPEDGMNMMAVGNVTVYEKGGQYQLNVLRLTPLGRGDLLARLEELKKKLASEGVFENKRPLPSYPETIGIITSSTGAAVHDIISILSRRAPHVHIILRPTLVQGNEASQDIVQGIREMNQFTNADILIVGRGGGSIEDLWCFNDESVARAIALSRIPVISAVGHETDITLADFASDLRAPTPSAAAEMVVRDVNEVKEEIMGYVTIMRQRIIANISELTGRVDRVQRDLSSQRFIQFILMKNQVVDEYSLRLRNACNIVLSEREKDYERLQSKLVTLNPRAVLVRGYSIVYREPDRCVVTDSALLEKEYTVSVELARGSFRGKVIEKK